VAGLAFGAVEDGDERQLQIGDAYALIPPFTGDGMAMAFEGAAAVINPIIGYISGETSWNDASRQARRDLRKRFKRRLAAASGIHSFLYEPTQQACFRVASSAHLLPFRPLFNLLH